MKARQGFVSNSSSTSFVVIEHGPRHYQGSWEGLRWARYEEEGDREFGWEKRTYNGLYTKVNFAYLQVYYARRAEEMGRNYTSPGTADRWKEMLDKVIMEHTGAVEVNHRIYDEEDAEDRQPWGYIDHQSSAIEGDNTEIFDDEETLKDFLFCNASYIQGGNDNDDYD